MIIALEAFEGPSVLGGTELPAGCLVTDSDSTSFETTHKFEVSSATFEQASAKISRLLGLLLLVCAQVYLWVGVGVTSFTVKW